MKVRWSWIAVGALAAIGCSGGGSAGGTTDGAAGTGGGGRDAGLGGAGGDAGPVRDGAAGSDARMDAATGGGIPLLPYPYDWQAITASADDNFTVAGIVTQIGGWAHRVLKYDMNGQLLRDSSLVETVADLGDQPKLDGMVVADQDQSTYVSGHTALGIGEPNSAVGSHTARLFRAKVGGDGKLVWVKYDASMSSTVFRVLSVDAQGNSFVLKSNTSEVSVSKFDADGEQVWKTAFNLPEQFKATFPNATVLLGGAHGAGSSSGTTFVWANQYHPGGGWVLSKVDADGKVGWSKASIDACDGNPPFIEAVGETSDGGATYAVGTCFMKFDRTGTTRWTKGVTGYANAIGQALDDGGWRFGIATTDSGEPYVLQPDPASTTGDGRIVRYDADANNLWDVDVGPTSCVLCYRAPLLSYRPKPDRIFVYTPSNSPNAPTVHILSGGDRSMRQVTWQPPGSER